MEKKIKILMGMLVIVALFVGCIEDETKVTTTTIILTTTTIDQREVIISTDKSEYELGEEVRITIENRLEEPIYFKCETWSVYTATTEYTQDGVRHISFGGEKIEITPRNYCVPDRCYNGTIIRGYCPHVHVNCSFSESTQTISHIWDQKMYVYTTEELPCGNSTIYIPKTERKLVSSGVYTVRSCYFTYPDYNTEKCVETEFTIKEK